MNYQICQKLLSTVYSSVHIVITTSLHADEHVDDPLINEVQFAAGLSVS